MGRVVAVITVVLHARDLNRRFSRRWVSWATAMGGRSAWSTGRSGHHISSRFPAARARKGQTSESGDEQGWAAGADRDHPARAATVATAWAGRQPVGGERAKRSAALTLRVESAKAGLAHHHRRNRPRDVHAVIGAVALRDGVAEFCATVRPVQPAVAAWRAAIVRAGRHCRRSACRSASSRRGAGWLSRRAFSQRPFNAARDVTCSAWVLFALAFLRRDLDQARGAAPARALLIRRRPLLPATLA
jgi:hypothetical protein